MAIAAANAVYTTNGPVASGQIFASSAQSTLETSFVYTATVTLDGATTNFVVNFIDGIQTLPYTPSAVTADITGGTQITSAVQGIAVGNITNTGFTVYLSTAGTNLNTLKIAGFILK